MVSISGSAHLQGRQYVDMSGWSEGSEDKGEVCVGCGGWVELGGDHRKVVVPFHMWSWVVVIEKTQLCSICHQ